MPNRHKQIIKYKRGALSPQELADRWGKSRQHIYDCLAEGQIMSFKSGRSRLISMSEVQRIEGGDR
jgi:excisionase family DNA binding protein